MKSILTPALVLASLLFSFTALISAPVDIPVMTWTPRSDWVNVKSAPYSAKGDGETDDTAAIQAALTTAGAHDGMTPTVYFPPGTYKITATLDWQGTSDWKGKGVQGAALIGCGRSTIIKWAGPSGAAMFWPKGATTTRYIGLAWDGSNLASCAYEASSPISYEYNIRHENESFRNFTVPGTYVAGETEPAAAIIGGLSIEHNTPDAEIMVWNCLFVNCTNGVVVAVKAFNNYLWDITGCEFEDCGTAIYNNHGRFSALDCHFQNSKVSDVDCNSSTKPCIRRCTSTGSRLFYLSEPTGGVGAKLIQDCRIDSWTNPEGAIQTGNVGPSEILDCVFTHPPDGGSKNPKNSPIVMTNPVTSSGLITVSNNTCPTVTEDNLVNMGPNPPANLLTIPPGSVPPIICQGPADRTFLHTAEQDDSTHIMDITQDPYKADKTGTADATAQIQSAINDAAKANNDSIVYLPYGTYKITGTINVTGDNYKIQGSGARTVLSWAGPDNSTFFKVTSPQKLSMEQIQFSFNGLKLKDVAAVNETSTTACSMNYDGIYYNRNGPHTPDAPGLKLDSLPAGSRVTAGDLLLPLTIHDCGPAEILLNYSIGGRVIVNGATQPKTGFLGIITGENGTLTASPDVWNILVDDNQNLVYGDYYQEQGHNCIKLSRGAGTGTGHVTISGIKQQSFNMQDTWETINIDNYSGRFYYGQVNFSNNKNGPTNFVQTGTNPCDFILDNTSFSPDSQPVFKLDKGTNLIRLNNVHSLKPPQLINVQPDGWGAAAAAALDDERTLGQYDLKWNYGITKPN